MKGPEIKEKIELLKHNIQEGIEISLKRGAKGIFICSSCKQEKTAGAVLKSGGKILCVECFLRIAEQKLSE